MAATGEDAHVGCRRWVIREMELENFKSYAGKQRVGPFHKSMSAVVGPNGSGKSNVIDAMLFVFGRRAKQLRFNKVSELIHNSTNFRNLDQARVTVFFQEIIDKEGEDFELVPGTEFTVARTATRSNTSDYYINGRKVPVKDVTDKLKGLGIDLDNNRFLILQGEVEQISMMKPKGEDKNDTGLLEFIEDVIGTDKYVAPIEQKSKELDEIQDKRQGMIQRLKISEKEKDSLEGKKAEAELFLVKQADMYRCRIDGTSIYISTTQANLTKYQAQSTELSSKLAHEQEKNRSYDARSKEAEKKATTVEKEYQVIAKALEQAEEEYKGFERRDAKLIIEQKNLHAKVKKLTTKLETDTAQAAKLEGGVEAIKADEPAAKERLAALQQNLANAEAALEEVHESIKGEVEGYHKQLSQVRSELAPWEKKIGEVSGRISVSTSERDVLARKSEDAKRRLDSALKSLTMAQQTAASKEKQIKDIEAQAAKCKQEIETHRKELASGQSEEKRLEAAAQEARERAAGLRAEVGASTQQSGLMVALMTARTKGEVSGLYGRLGDLGAIDPQYDVAVSTAVGALDYVVVETASDAQRCVEYLRRNNLGVATFLILEKQKHLAAAAAEKVPTPQGAPRLYDLVRIKDDKLRPAFFYAMGNTLVAKDLEQASAIAYGADKRFRRVVTLQGQLIAESGTMSGGGGKPQRGRMKLGSAAPRGDAGMSDARAAAAELKAAEAALEQLVAQLKSVRDSTAALEKALRAAEKQLEDLETKAPKARMEAAAESAKAADIQQRLEELKAATQISAEDASRIAELSTEVAREERAVAELRAQTAGLEKQAAAIQDKIDGAGGERLKKAKSCVTKLQKEVADAEAEGTKRAVQVKTSTKSAEKLHKDIAKDEKELESAKASLVNLSKELEELTEQAAKVMELVEDTKNQLAKKQVELDSAKRELASIATDHATVRKVEHEIETALEMLSKATREESAKIVRWQADIERLQSQLQELAGEAYMVDESALAGVKAEDCIFKASVYEADLEKMSVDLGAIEEYKKRKADYEARAAELDAVTAQRDEVRKAYEGLRKARLDEFMAGFNIISLKLKEMYQMITLGGDAELELVDSLDPFSEGIVFSVRPPKKSWKNISNLSGGEKTLSSLSLVFALHHYKPTPLYVMDEIDAALDFKNVSIVGHYIKDRTKNAQFVIISLRNNMFELADRLVGIYKTDNTTKTIAINPGEYVVQEAPAAQDATQGAQQQAPAAPAAGTKASQQQQRRQGKENLGKQVLSSEHEQEEQQAMAVS